MVVAECVAFLIGSHMVVAYIIILNALHGPLQIT